MAEQGREAAEEFESEDGAGAPSDLAAGSVAEAIALRAAAPGRGVDVQTIAFLQKQGRMIDIQTEHLHEQRNLILRNLRLRSWREMFQLGTQLSVALVAALFGLWLVVMVVEAARSRAVVVEAFDAPPALAPNGLSGKVVASALLDQLTRLQAATHARLEKRRLLGAWAGEIRVEVPETGINISELDRILKARLGHDVHIGGDLVETSPDQLALTVRGDDITPKTFTGGRQDLESLTTQAAEYIFGRAEPSLFAEYLVEAGRNADAIAFAKAAFATAAPSERPYLLNAWANALTSLGQARSALALYREAARMKPDYWSAYNNVQNTFWALGDEEAAWRSGRDMERAAHGHPGRAGEFYFQTLDELVWNLQPWRAAYLQDAAANAGVGTDVGSVGAALADIDQRLHDPADAELQLQTALGQTKDPTIAAMTHFVHGRLAAEAGDATRAATELEAFGAAYADPSVAGQYPGYDCWIAPAEEAAGRPALADAVLKKAGRFVDCARFRADILDHRGQWPAAQRAYADAVRIAPDLPAAYLSWGEALLRHGDVTGAIEKLSAAHARGSGWADPLEAWGRALVRQGRPGAARAKFDQALELAPAWDALKRERDALARGR